MAHSKLIHENFSMSINVLFIKIMGFWPWELRSWFEIICYYTYSTVIMLIFISFLISQFIELFLIRADMTEVTSNLQVTLIYLMSLAKRWSVLKRRREIYHLIAGISEVEAEIFNSETDSGKALYRSHINRTVFVNKLIWILIMFITFLFLMSPVLSYTLSGKYHKTFSNGTIWWSYEKPLIFSSWVPFDRYSLPNFYYVYSYQMINGLLGSTSHIFYDATAVACMLHCVGQVQLLRHNLTLMKGRTQRKMELVKEKDVDIEWNNVDSHNWFKINDSILRNHIHHKYIIRFTNSLDEIMSPVMTLYFFVCSLNLCVALYQVSVIEDRIQLVVVVVYTLSMLGQLFWFYWHSNEVIYESNRLVEASYNCLWYEESIKFQKEFMLLRHGMKKQLSFTVRPLYTMSMSTFIAIIKASYSYFAFIRQRQLLEES